MSTRNKFAILIGIILVASLAYYLLTTPRNKDLVLVGTVDGNQVIVSPQIQGRLAQLLVDEGSLVKKGDLIAVLDPSELEAAERAAAANIASLQHKVSEMRATEQATTGSTSSNVTNAQAKLQSVRAQLLQAQATLQRTQSDSQRTIALAKQGVASDQDRVQAETNLQAQQAVVESLKEQVSASEADVKTAMANTHQAHAAQSTVQATLSDLANAEEMRKEAEVRLGYTKIYAPVTGTVSVRAALQGEVLNAGQAIVTIMDLSDTWVRAAIPETYADHIGIGDTLRLQLPGGTITSGKVFYKAPEADFATQRDVNRMKRDIRTIVLKVRLDNPNNAFVPGMTANVLVSPEQLNGKAEQASASPGKAAVISDPVSSSSAGTTASGREPVDSVANAIEVDHIVKKYGDFTAVDDVSFFVREEEIFGLLGPNGAGKSTLIRMMTTLIPITSGKARIAGYDVKEDPDDVRRAIGVIPQALTSDIDLTVQENLSIYAKLYDVPSQKRKEAIDELLELVDLTKWRDAQTKTLSGGMRRRLEIARGLVHSPRIFFLDEPTTGLDPVSRVAVWEMLTNIKSHRKLTILITTHYMDEADRLCDRIAIVDHGKLVALDTPAALKASVPGSNVIEAHFDHAPADWEKRLHTLTGVTSVQHEGAGMYRVLTSDGSKATTELVEMAVKAGVRVKSLSVQNTTLDDVFVHYTGRQLRDELQKSYGFVMPPRPGMQP